MKYLTIGTYIIHEHFFRPKHPLQLRHSKVILQSDTTTNFHQYHVMSAVEATLNAFPLSYNTSSSASAPCGIMAPTDKEDIKGKKPEGSQNANDQESSIVNPRHIYQNFH